MLVRANNNKHCNLTASEAVSDTGHIKQLQHELSYCLSHIRCDQSNLMYHRAREGNAVTQLSRITMQNTHNYRDCHSASSSANRNRFHLRLALSKFES